MKILKGIGIGLVLILAVYVILALFGPSKSHVERSMMVNASSATVYNEINTLTHWKSWSYWDNIDPKMESTYEGPESGVGAKHSWKSESDSVGVGSLTITKSEPDTFVETTLEFEGMGTSVGGWKIADTTGGVLVTTYMDMDIPFLYRPMMLFMDMDEMLGADFEKSLKGLKDHTEKLPSPEMTAEYVSEMSTLPVMKIMTIKDSATLAELPGKFGALYGEIQEEMKKQNLSPAGPALAIYDKVETRADGSMYFWFQAGLSVDKAGKSTARVNYMESQAVTAVKCDYHGGYNNMEACHESINKYITSNGKMQNGPVWEVYVTDPGMEPDSTKWLTQIYYPVQ